MKIPILKLRNCLLISIQWELDDQTALQFQEDLLTRIHEKGANGVVIDLTSYRYDRFLYRKSIGRCDQHVKAVGGTGGFNRDAACCSNYARGTRHQLDEVLTALGLEKGLEKLQQELGE